jgi:hypothetical protein
LGKNAPQLILVFFSGTVLFCCAMSFRVENPGLEVVCRDQFKEYDEGI